MLLKKKKPPSPAEPKPDPGILISDLERVIALAKSAGKSTVEMRTYANLWSPGFTTIEYSVGRCSTTARLYELDTDKATGRLSRRPMSVEVCMTVELTNA